MNLNESIIEDAALTWFLLCLVRQAQGYGGQFKELGYSIEHELEMAPAEKASERNLFYE